MQRSDLNLRHPTIRIANASAQTASSARGAPHSGECLTRSPTRRHLDAWRFYVFRCLSSGARGRLGNQATLWRLGDTKNRMSKI